MTDLVSFPALSRVGEPDYNLPKKKSTTSNTTFAGMTMVGVIPALVNSNLRQQSLLHTITVAKARAVVFSSELTSGEYSTALGFAQTATMQLLKKKAQLHIYRSWF